MLIKKKPLFHQRTIRGVLHRTQLLIVRLRSLAQRRQCRHWRRGPRVLQPIYAGVATGLWPCPPHHALRLSIDGVILRSFAFS